MIWARESNNHRVFFSGRGTHNTLHSCMLVCRFSVLTVSIGAYASNAQPHTHCDCINWATALMHILSNYNTLWSNVDILTTNVHRTDLCAYVCSFHSYRVLSTAITPLRYSPFYFWCVLLLLTVCFVVCKCMMYKQWVSIFHKSSIHIHITHVHISSATANWLVHAALMIR